jgi:hypothetical protein
MALTQQQFMQLMGGKREPVTASLASVLDIIKKPLDYYAVDKRVPLVGGQSAADLIGLSGTQSLVQDFSQGKPMMRDGLPDERFIDAAGMIPMIKPAAVGAGQAAKYLGKEALRQGYEGTGLLGKIAPDIKMPITAWHGSPYRFDKFDPTKIGSGEGAQAYGHGLYFAENPKVAESYKNMSPDFMSGVPIRRALNGVELKQTTPEYHAATLLSRNGMTLNQARKDVSGWIEEGIKDPRLTKEVEGWKKTLDTLNSVSKKSAFSELPHEGQLYKVDIPDTHIENMLNWDKPISQQTPKVIAAINKTKKSLTSNDLAELGGDAGLLYGKDITPAQFLNTWEIIRGQPNVGESLLNQHGVKGVKYFDNPSRDAMKGTQNFVVFDSDIVKILERNKQPIK